MSDRWLYRFLFLALAIYAGIYFFRPVEVGDSFWHLSLGRWMLEHREFVRTDPFPLHPGEAGPPWMYLQWLGGGVFALVERLAGFTGLKLLRAAVMTAAAGIVVLWGRRRLSAPALAVVVLLVMHGLLRECLLRPLIFNFLYLQMLLMIAFAHLKTGRRGGLYALPLLGALWSNTHAGSLIYGGTVIAMFALHHGVAFLDALLDRARRGEAFRHRRLGVQWLLGAAGYFAGFFLNPYGTAGALHGVRLLVDPGYIGFYRFNDIVREMQPPAGLLDVGPGGEGLWFLLLTLPVLAVILVHRRYLFLNLILLAAGLALYLYGERGQGFYTLICAWLLIENTHKIRAGQSPLPDSPGRKPLQEKEAGEASRTPPSDSAAGDKTARPAIISGGSPFPRPSAAGRLLAVLIILWCTAGLIRHAHSFVVTEYGRQRWLGLPVAASNPHSAIQALARNSISGPVFADDMNGGYLLWYGYPGLRPLVDGRQADRTLFARYRAVITDPETHWPVAEKDLGLDIALVDFSLGSGGAVLRYLHQRPDWQLIHLNGVIALFVRRDAFPLEPREAQLEKRFKEQTWPPAWTPPAGPDRWEQWRQTWLFPPDGYNKNTAESLILRTLDYWPAAARRLRAAEIMDHGN